jgi:DNA-binding transcriptional ArsR family regulator
MPKLEQRTIQRDLTRAEKVLLKIAEQQGKDSQQYRIALQHFGRLWAILKMTRSRNEFFAEITSKQR